MNTRAFTALFSVSVTSAFTSGSVKPHAFLPSRALALTALANARGTSAAARPLPTSSFPPTPAFPRAGQLTRGMASAATEGCDACVDIEESVGFKRPDMNNEYKHFGIKTYDAHVLVITTTPASEWPSDAFSTGGVCKVLDGAIKAAKASISSTLKVTVCEAVAGDEEGDVLFFPPASAGGGARRYKLAARDEAAATDFATKVLGFGDLDGVPNQALGPQAFVCAHAQRDGRCGHCGPVLLGGLREAVGSSAQVRAVSHVGGHAYAGNVILWAGKSLDWYGYVCPTHVPALAEVLKGNAVDTSEGGALPATLLRGRMGQKSAPPLDWDGPAWGV